MFLLHAGPKEFPASMCLSQSERMGNKPKFSLPQDLQVFGGVFLPLSPSREFKRGAISSSHSSSPQETNLPALSDETKWYSFKLLYMLKSHSLILLFSALFCMSSLRPLTHCYLKEDHKVTRNTENNKIS
jgi:hypothetical protein